MTLHKRISNRTDRISFRVHSGEMAEISANADASGLSISSFIRRCLLGLRISSAIDLKMINELRRLRGLIKNFHNQTGGIFKEKTALILDELHAAIIRIGQQQRQKGGDTNLQSLSRGQLPLCIGDDVTNFLTPGNRTEFISVRVSSEEMLEVSASIDVSGLRVSSFARNCVLGKRIGKATDYKTLNDLRKIGAQIKNLFNKTSRLCENQSALALDELCAAIVRIGQPGDNIKEVGEP